MREITREKLNYPLKNFLGDVWNFLGRHKTKFVILSLIIAFSSFLELVPPIITSKIIDFFTSYSKGESLNPFYIYIIILFAVMAIGTFLRIGGKHFFTIHINTIQKEVKTESFKKLMEGDLFWHDKENTGNKMQKISDGVSAIGSLMDFYINSGISMIVSIVGIIVIFTYFGVKYALIALGFMLLYIVLDFLFNKKLGKKTIKVQIAKEKAAGKAYEFSSNISTVKSLGIEKSANEEVYFNEENILQARNERRKVATTKWTVVQIISVIFYVIFAFTVGRDVIVEAVTIGSIVIYLSYVGRIQSTLNQISGYSDMLIDTRYSIYRMVGLYNSIPKIKEEGAIDLKKWNSLVAENISFKYRNEEVLENFSFRINKGEKIGVVGISGSGKSTLFKLLLKLYLPQKGMIYFDSMAITGLKRDSVTKRISIVPQETEVFNISFRDNVTISTPGNINYKKYRQALELSQCIPIISKLKDRDLTLIGEKGVRLSGGEKQRLGIARALYKGSDIFIFDESTSNLDYETERKIQDAFDSEFKEKTLIFAAHRLSTLRNMDRILVIEKGKVVEEGSYNQLVRQRGEFYRILKKQESKNRH